MPPKRKVPAKAAATVLKTTTNTRGKDAENTAAASRSKRNSTLPGNIEPTHQKAERAAKGKSTTVTNAPGDVAPRKRGRPSTKTTEAIEEAGEDTAPAPAQVKKRLRSSRSTGDQVKQTEDIAIDEDEEETAPVARNRGRSSKSITAGAPAAKRGREAADEEVEEEDDEEQVEPKPHPKKRGRPAKTLVEDEPEDKEVQEPPAKKRARAAKASTSTPKVQQTDTEPTKRGRGRPAKAQTEDKPDTKSAKQDGRKTKPKAKPEPVIDDEEEEEEEEEETKPVAKKRSRSANLSKTAPEKPTRQAHGKARAAAPAQEDEEPKVAPKKRGRPKKPVAPMPGDATEQLDEELAAVTATPKPKGLKRKTPVAKGPTGKKARKDAAADDEEVDTSNEVNPTEATTELAVDADEDGRQYWLLKAEPDSRLEKTVGGKMVDVKFSIEDLEAKTDPEPWEGIRNLQAQKNMRAMKNGDLAFFYASNTKVPGIVGIMEIVSEASPDASAFDKNSPYYDEKSDPKKPKWNLVHVAFRRKFPEKITLKEIQKYSKDGGVLADLQLTKQSRLSVSKVTPAEWKFILSLVEDDEDDKPKEEDADRADFASAFEAPATMLEHVEAEVEENDDTTEDVVGTSMEVTEAMTDEVASRTAFSPTVEEPMSGTEDAHTHSGGLLGSIKSAVGLGGKTPSRAGSAKPASCAGSVGLTSTGSAKNGLGAASHRARSKTPLPGSSAVPESIVEEQQRLSEGDEDDVDEDGGVGAALAKPLSYA